MSLPISSTGMNHNGDRFPSLTALRVAHNRLFRRYHEQRSAPDVLQEIAVLIRKGKATGALLDNEDDRWAGQGLLDYWSSMLYRAGYEPPNATLDAFDPTYAPTLDDSLCPYINFDQSQMQLANSGASDLREAIEKPAELIGLKFEEGVIDALIQDTLYEPDGLSLLQFILLSLWEKRDRNKITWESYQQIGRGRQALIQTADQLITGLSPEEQEILKRIMLNLAQFGNGPNLVKRKITRSELYTLLGIPEASLSAESNQIAPLELHPLPEVSNVSSNEVRLTSGKPPVAFDQILQMLASDSSSHFESDSPYLQKRFQTLLTNRFRREVDRSPPLFPWEAELSNYEAEESTPLNFTAPSFWGAQLAHLQLPVTMPENLLEQLLERCRAIKGSLQLGIKLVQAVETFFPGQLQPLNHLAGMVLTAPARSGRTMMAGTQASSALEHYNGANPIQKMALSLLAAREIFNSLTLTLSLQQPVVERRWETTIGTLMLKAAYQNNQLLVEGQLPCAGELSLHHEASNIDAHHSTDGFVRLSLPNPRVGKNYPLIVQLDAPDRPSMSFTVQVEA